MNKEEIISFLENEKWHPAVHPTNVEWEASKRLNQIIDTCISQIKAGKIITHKQVEEFLQENVVGGTRDSEVEELETAVLLDSCLSRIWTQIRHDYE